MGADKSNITYKLRDNTIEIFGYDLKEFDKELLVHFNRISEEEYKDLNHISLEYILQTLDNDYDYSLNGIVSDMWIGVHLGYHYKSKPKNSYNIHINCYNINRAIIAGLIILDKIKSESIIIDDEERVLDLSI